MVEFREGIAHADSLAQNNPAQSFSVQLIQVLVTGGGAGRKKPLESNLQGVLAQQRRVSELRCCNCGRWGSEVSSYVADGQEQSRRLGRCIVTSTSENQAVYGMH